DPDYRPALRFIAPDDLAAGHLERAADAYARLASDLPGDAELGIDGAELLSERTSAAGVLAELALKARPGSELRGRLAGWARAVIASLLEAAPGHRSLLAHL